MKRKNYLSILLAIVFVLGLATPTMAATSVTIKGTNIKATYKVTVKKSKISTSAATKKIKAYKKSAKKIKANIKKVKLANTYGSRRTQYYKFIGKMKSLENKLERLEDKWETRYETGKVSRTKYKTIERKVEQVENYLDQVEDYLDRKFRYEFDD